MSSANISVFITKVPLVHAERNHVFTEEFYLLKKISCDSLVGLKMLVRYFFIVQNNLVRARFSVQCQLLAAGSFT